MKKLNFFFGTMFIFTLLSWLSYHNGMAYDGENKIGFPLIFYIEAAGKSLDTGHMGQYSNYSFPYLLIDLACSFLIYLALRFLVIILKRKS